MGARLGAGFAEQDGGGAADLPDVLLAGDDGLEGACGDETGFGAHDVGPLGLEAADGLDALADLGAPGPLEQVDDADVVVAAEQAQVARAEAVLIEQGVIALGEAVVQGSVVFARGGGEGERGSGVVRGAGDGGHARASSIEGRGGAFARANVTMRGGSAGASRGGRGSKEI